MTVEGFEPADPVQEAYFRYGSAPIPDARDCLVVEFIDQVLAGEPAAVAALAAGPSDRGLSVLRAFAERMASLAVRRGDSRLLVKAVVAVVAGGLSRGDPAALMVMPLIEHSVGLLDQGLADIFWQAAGAMEAWGPAGARSLGAWLARAPQDRTLASMGYAESEDDGGFRYRYRA